MAIFFLAYVVGYPALQLYTLWRCVGGWKVASIICVVPMGPFYLWSLFKVFGPQENGDLSGIFIVLIAPLALVYLAALALAYEMKVAQAKPSLESPVSPFADDTFPNPPPPR